MSFRIIKRAAKYCGRQTFRSLPSRARKFIHSASADEPSKEFEQAAAEFKELIDRSISAANSRDFDAAERCLREAAMLDPSNPEIAPHLGRVRFLRSRDGEPGLAAQTQSMLATIGSIRREIESKSLYVPSRYWERHGAFHTALLERYGIENFKRTVSHDYQNWFMTDLHDPQVRQLFNKWPDHFAKEPWFNVMEVPDNVGYQLSMNFEKPTNPLASLSQREFYRICVGLLWEYVARTDAANVLARLTESEIGNPYRIWRKGQLISSDLAH